MSKKYINQSPINWDNLKVEESDNKYIIFKNMIKIENIKIWKKLLKLYSNGEIPYNLSFKYNKLTYIKNDKKILCILSEEIEELIVRNNLKKFKKFILKTELYDKNIYQNLNDNKLNKKKKAIENEEIEQTQWKNCHKLQKIKLLTIYTYQLKYQYNLTEENRQDIFCKLRLLIMKGSIKTKNIIIYNNRIVEIEKFLYKIKNNELIIKNEIKESKMEHLAIEKFPILIKRKGIPKITYGIL